MVWRRLTSRVMRCVHFLKVIYFKIVRRDIFLPKLKVRVLAVSKDVTILSNSSNDNSLRSNPLFVLIVKNYTKNPVLIAGLMDLAGNDRHSCLEERFSESSKSTIK